MNRIYNTIWNEIINQWVVVSELARGKIKRSNAKTLVSAVLGVSIMSPAIAIASECNNASLTCLLDSSWSALTNNFEKGSVTIYDGQSYHVKGPNNAVNKPSSSITYNNINNLINDGYVDSPLIPIEDISLIMGVMTKSIVVFDPITNSNKTVIVYDSANIRERAATQILSGTSVLRGGPLDVYIRTRFATVKNGTVNFDMDNEGNTVIIRAKNTQLIYADGSGPDKAEANWTSKNTVALWDEVDWLAAPTVNLNVNTNKFVDRLVAFDGSEHVINSLASYQAYNDFLIKELEGNRLSYASYTAQLARAYTTTPNTYVLNRIPNNADQVYLNEPVGVNAILFGSGSNAVVTITNTGHLNTTAEMATLSKGSPIYLEKNAFGINDGEFTAGNFAVTVNTGAHFVNNKYIGFALNNGNGRGVNVDGIGSDFVNNGVVNLAPKSTFTNSSQNGMNYIATLNNGSNAINNGTYNVGINEGNKGRGISGMVIGARVLGSDSSFINNESGQINVGYAENGSDVYTQIASGGIYASGLNSNVLNKGIIRLSKGTNGSYGILAEQTSGGIIKNSGSIVLNSNGDNGSFITATNVGILSQKNANGVFNTGTIDIIGTNSVGLKAITGSQIASSGVINISGGTDPSTGVHNYGAWSEGKNSLIDISGSINLKGDGAIGVHARNEGGISLSGEGEVTFADGENQIGYFIYGKNTTISNSSSGSQDVTTKNSILMRLDGGVTFLGSSGATSTMSASGDNAKVIVATGKGTTVDSGGMAVNIAGENATGFLIEGGATGTIAAEANINLSGMGAIAGIADGQGYDLAGRETTLDAGTKLTSGAKLTSDLEGVTGYIARNQATLKNTGDIIFTGNNSTGIQVAEGATGGNGGNITLGGAGSIGLVASAQSKNTKLSSTGNITLNGHWDGGDDATRTTGVLADGGKVAVTIGDGVNVAIINLNGAGSVGIHATGGSQVILKDKVAVTFGAGQSDQIAYWVDGLGSEILTVAGATPTVVQGDGLTLFYVTNQATMAGDLNINLSATAGSNQATSGIRVQGDGSVATLGGGSQVTVGTNATGVLAEAGGKAIIDAGAAFDIAGTHAVVGHSTGADSVVENAASVTSGAGSSGSIAFLAENGGTVENQGNIDLSLGSNHTAIDVNNGHVVNSGNISANGTAIHIKGADSTIANSGTIVAVDGKAAIHVDAGAALDLAAAAGGSGTIVAKGSADGILLDAGALGLNVANTLIDLSDATATGIGIHNVAEIEGIKLDNTDIIVGGSGIGIKTGAALAAVNSGNIEVANGVGILFAQETGEAVAFDLDLTGSGDLNISVTGSGTGIKASLDGNTFSSGINVEVTDATGGSAIDVAGATIVNNTGKLSSASTVAGGSVLNVHDAAEINNSGQILAASSQFAAIEMSQAGDTTFNNSGDVTGYLDFKTGNNHINLLDGGVDGDMKASGGANTLTASGQSSHVGTLTLTGDQMQTVTVSDTARLGDVVMTGTAAHQLHLSDAASVTGTTTLGNGHNTIRLSDDAQLTGALTTGLGNNALTLTDNAHISSFTAADGGENQVLIQGSATFESLDAGKGGTNDRLTFDGASYILADAADVQHFDSLNLTNGSRFSTAEVIQMGDDGLRGKIAIDATSTLALNPTGVYDLNHGLIGTGLIDVQSGSRFAFGANAGNQFAGTVNMKADAFALAGLNTTALSQVILNVMDGNTTTVGTGTQAIGGLAFAGGTVDFGVSVPNAIVSDQFVQANSLDANGAGKVQIRNGGFDNGTPVVPGQSAHLLDQQGEGVLVQLASANTVTGAGGNLTLVDENGAEISNATATAINQGGVHAADAKYDYRLVTDGAGGKGLYVGYGLTEINLLTSNADQLVINTAVSSQKVLSAKVTGSGDLGVKAGNGGDALTISNLNNSYTGATDVQTGTLIVGTDNALGQTSKLALAGTTTADLNGKKQTIGELDGKAASTLALKGGELTISNGGTSSGALTGAGKLNVAGGKLTINNANAGLSATTTVATAAEAVLKDVKALGTGNVVANGKVTIDNADGVFANNVSDAGLLNSHNGSDVTLAGDNTAFAGIMDVDGTSTLTVTETKHIGGTTEIKNANEVHVNNAAAMSLAAIVSGEGDLIKDQAETLTLTGTNTYTGNTQIKDGIVAISADANLGAASNQTILDGGDLQITETITSNRKVTMAQVGSVIVDDAKVASLAGWIGTGGNDLTKDGAGTLIFTGDNSGSTAGVNVAQGTLQVADTSNIGSATGTVNISTDATLALLKDAGSAADVDFTRQISGTGEFKVDLGNKAQELTFNDTAKGGSFAGQLSLDNGRIVLNEVTDDVLGSATLQLNGNGIDPLGSTKLEGERTVGGLTMNGGQLEVAYSAIDNRPEGHLTVANLDVTGGGNVAITTPVDLPNPLPASGTSLFDQDDYVYDQIVTATNVNGVGTQMALTDVDGNKVADDVTVGLNQGGTVAGNVHYNYLAAVKDDGVHVGYGLTQIDAFSSQSVILDNANAIDDALGVKLTGDGGFSVNATGTVRIGNAASDYTGATDVNTGKVVLITNNAFGQTEVLNLASGTGVDLNGNSQTVGELNTQASSTLDFNQGDLTVTNGGESAGELKGEGNLNIASNTLSLTSNSSLFTGTTNVAEGATARLTQPQGLGQGLINNAGTVNLDTAKGTLLNTLGGQGDVLLSNGADMWLGGDNKDFAGSFTTQAGTQLTATAANQLGTANVANIGTLVLDTEALWDFTTEVAGSGTIVKRGTGTVQIDGSHVQAGLTEIENGLVLVGGGAAEASSANLTSNALIKEHGALGGHGTVTGNVENAGQLAIGKALVGGTEGTFTIDGDYKGSGGLVSFNTTLGGDASATDTLRITGSTSGTSDVSVLSAKGEGALTQEGIKLIDVGGQSNGQFVLKGRAVAGAYEYFLYQGGVANPADGDWYLRSELEGGQLIFRPETGVYVANTAAAQNMFNHRLEDREGRAEDGGVWIRMVGSQTKQEDSTGKLDMKTNTYVVQAGTELNSIPLGTEAGRLNVGVMLAYGEASSKVNAAGVAYQAKGKVTGFTPGVYATWYQDADTLNGAYVDSWLQYSWLKGDVKGEKLAKENYRLDGFSASVEGGYRIPVYQGLTNTVLVTPQAQLTWNGIKADRHTEVNGTMVDSLGENNFQTRLGVKVSSDSMAYRTNVGKPVTTYAALNWVHNNQHAGATLTDNNGSTNAEQAGNQNLAEVKLGIEGGISKQVDIWGNVVYQFGKDSYSDTALTIGMKYRF